MRASAQSSQVALHEIAAKIVSRGLQTPAVFFLELHKPLANILHHGALALTPALSPIFGLERLQNCSAFLADRDNIERLIVEIENISTKQKSN